MRNCGIAIGINRYENVQSLSCAQRDAEAIVEFFRTDLNCELVYHFAEDAPAIATDHGPPLSPRPTFGTLMRFLRTRFEQPFLQAGDNLWFFFAGHGICHENRDYLMPLDTDPGDVERTAIPIGYIAGQLRRCGADNVVLLVDACRTASRSGIGLSNEVQQGIVSLFSCSPHERSYEIEEPPIQHGAFTYALLQGLKLQGEGNCATVERLYHYLRHQVPALNQRYQKPRQTPYAIVEPASKYHLILLPRVATVQDAAALKLDAFRAEQEGNYELSEQLWIRILVVSPTDQDAIAGIRRTGRELAQPPSAPPLPEPPPPSRAFSERRDSRPLLPNRNWLNHRLSRRRLLQLAGMTGGAFGGAWLSQTLYTLIKPNSSRKPPASLKIQGGILGVLSGAGIAAIVGRYKSFVRTLKDVKEITQVPLLAHIPFCDSLSITDLLHYEQNSPHHMNSLSSSMIHDTPVTFTESFRSLYTNIRLSNEGDLRSIAISSATPNEGKSTIAIYLAKVAAAAGQRVLLVDTDLRRPSVHRYLACPNSLGLTDAVINSNLDLSEVVQPITHDLLWNGSNFSVITSGPIPPNPTSFLTSRRMTILHEEAMQEYDLIIYDTPPLMGFPDSLLVSQFTDGLLLVVGLRKVKEKILSDAIDELNISRISVIGSVANYGASRSVDGCYNDYYPSISDR